MQVIIHAGLPKTGSSAVQEYLTEERERLRSLGVIYPAFDDHKSHWMLTAAFHNTPEAYHHVRRRMHGADLQTTIEETKRELRECISLAGPDAVLILSHEGIGNLNTSEGMHGLRELLHEYTDQIRVIAYGRNPVDLYASAVQQRIKSLTSDARPPSDWVSNHGQRAETLVNVFGAEHCEIRVYSPSTLIRGDVIADFSDYVLKTTGKELPPPGARRTNASLSGPACAILMALRREPDIERKDYAKIRGLLGRFGSTHAGAKLKIPDEWRSTLIAANHEGWNGLVERTRYSDEQKASLRLPALSEKQSIRRRKVATWILSYGDPAYTTEFAAFCRKNAHVKSGRVAELAKRVEHIASQFSSRPDEAAPILLRRPGKGGRRAEKTAAA